MELSRANIGKMLGAWGIGNLLAFFYSLKKRSLFNAQISSFIFISALGLFLAQGPLWTGLVGFLLGGFFNSYLAGLLRNKISQSIPKEVRSLDVWAAVNQRMGLINILIYGTGGYLLDLISATTMGGFMIVVGVLLGLSLKKTNWMV